MRTINTSLVSGAWPQRFYQSSMELGDLEGIFNSLWDAPSESLKSFEPECDIQETKDSYWLQMDAPGVRLEDLKIEVLGRELVIAGERQHKTKAEDAKVAHVERTFGHFQRRWSLPKTADADHIEASFEDGVLTVAIPKAAAEKARSISIRSGTTEFNEKIAAEEIQITE